MRSAGRRPRSGCDRIPLGIDLARFPLGDEERRHAARATLGIARRRVRRRLVPEGRRWDGGRARAEARSRDRTCSSRRSRSRRSGSTTLVVLLTGLARGYVRRGLDRRGVPHVHRLLPDRDALDARTTRSTPTLSRRGRRAARRASSSRWRRGPARHDARRAGAGSRRATAKTASSSPVEDADAISSPLSCASRATRRSSPRSASRAARRPRRPRTRGSRHAGARCSRASRPRPWLASASARYGRAGARWARLLADVRPARGCASCTAGTASPRRASPRRRHGEAAEARRALAEPAGRLHAALPRHAATSRATSRRSSGSRGGAARRSSSTRTASPTRAGRATGPRSSTCRCAARSPPPTTSSTRARSASAPPTSSSAEPRGEWEILHNAVDVDRFTPGTVPPDGPLVLRSAATRRRPTGSSSRSRRCGRAGRRTLARACWSPAARLAIPAPTIARLGLGAAVELVGRYSQREAPDVFRRAHVLLHTKVNDPCPTAVLEAMACGLPVVHPASGGTVELVGEGGHRRPASDDVRARLAAGAEALAEAVSPSWRTATATPRRRARRAVERFALEPWLDRHAELFAKLTSS